MGTILYKKHEDFGNRLKELRKKKYKIQEKFAEDMGVSVESVRNWEQGRILPEMGTLFKICDLLDCDLDYLTGRLKLKTHDLQFIHDQTGLSETAIRKLQRLTEAEPDWDQKEKALIEDAPEIPKRKIRELIKKERERYENSVARDYPEILSLLIENTNAEYLLSLITRRVTGYPQTRSADRPLTEDDLWIDLDGQRVLTHKRNMLDSLIQTEVSNLIHWISEDYHSTKTEL